jgi:NAD(P)-dependent dehydrogenase (short-subunit alcohol dehydrogenase family)
MPRTVIVTGASSGIGLAIAKRLQKAGWEVVGLSRTVPKEPYSFAYVTADLADEDAVKRVVREKILPAVPVVDALVNCAGMGISGAIEETALADAKRLFDINPFGAFVLTRELLPALRASKGRIVNISSVAAEFTIPFQAFYSMSKAALSVFTDALRLELKPFGVQACAILPGDTVTGFTAARSKAADNGPYGDRVVRSVSRMERDEQNGMAPDTVARIVERVLQKKRMPPAVTVGFQYKLFLFLRWILPKRFIEAILYSLYGK